MEFYLAQIVLFGGNFAPTRWLPCDGRLLPITENVALFSLLGTQYGGDGKTTFALPTLASPAGEGQFPAYLICVQGVYPPRD